MSDPMGRGRIQSLATVVGLLTAFVAIATAIGVLSAGLAIPAAAVVGTATTHTLALYDSLPDDFVDHPPSQGSTLLASDGKTVLGRLYEQDRTVVALDDISPWMRRAQVAIEDHRFYGHGGVDLQGVGSAVAVAGAAAGGAARGASTLTQQYVKVSLHEAALARGDHDAARAATAVTPARKLQELRYAVALEKRLSKDDILSRYLNLVYFGNEAYGIQAAARRYFFTTAARLTLPQAATLAGVVQQPGTRDPIAHPVAALARRNEVLDAMRRYGDITLQQAATAKAAPLGLHPSPAPPNGCPTSAEPYWCSYVVAWLKEQPALGDSPNAREATLRRGGYAITTTLDPRLQQRARQALATTISPRDYQPDGPHRYGGAAVTTDTHTGKVRAMVQSTHFLPPAGSQPTGPAHRVQPAGVTQVNWAVDTRYGGSRGFSVGSNMKLFTLVEAMRQHLGTRHVITGIRPEHTRWRAGSFQPGCTVGPVGWPVKNSEGNAAGPTMTLRQATARSVNTAFVALAARLGTCAIRDTALAMGMHTATLTDPTATDHKPLPTPAPAVLLGADASPATMAQMYATIANGGLSCPNLPIESITTRTGTRVNLHQPGCRRVLTPDVADQVKDLLTSVMTQGSGRRLQVNAPTIGKTGTDEDNETWFTGATADHATSVWIGTPDDNKLDWRHPTLHDSHGTPHTRSASGAALPGPVWQAITRATLHHR